MLHEKLKYDEKLDGWVVSEKTIISMATSTCWAPQILRTIPRDVLMDDRHLTFVVHVNQELLERVVAELRGCYFAKWRRCGPKLLMVRVVGCVMLFTSDTGGDTPIIRPKYRLTEGLKADPKRKELLKLCVDILKHELLHGRTMKYALNDARHQDYNVWLLTDVEYARTTTRAKIAWLHYMLENFQERWTTVHRGEYKGSLGQFIGDVDNINIRRYIDHVFGILTKILGDNTNEGS